MLYDEFKEYLEKNASGYDVFMVKASEFQDEKNKNRAPKKRWNQKKLDRAVEGMWNQLARNTYEQIKAQKGVPKFNGAQIWIDFMNETEFVDLLNESISDIEFE